MTPRIAILVILILAALGARGQSVVTLKPVARLDADQPITLGDIATLTGDALALAELVILSEPTLLSGPDRRLTVSLEDVRSHIAETGTIGTGRLSIRGDACRVILRTQRVEIPAEIDDTPSFLPDSQVGYTIKDHVVAKLIQTLGIHTDHLQLTFDEADAALLATGTQGWTVDVQPTGSSAKVPLRITMYDRHGEIRDESIRVGVRILREVVRTTRALRRGTTLTPDDFEIDEAWLAPDVQFVEPIAATNIRLKRSLGAGVMLTSGHIQYAEVIKRGDIVSVHVISGTIVLRTPARALESGRIGEQIEFEPMNSKGRFAAVIKAAGRAVVMASTPPLEEVIR